MQEKGNGGKFHTLNRTLLFKGTFFFRIKMSHKFAEQVKRNRAEIVKPFLVEDYSSINNRKEVARFICSEVTSFWRKIAKVCPSLFPVSFLSFY